MAGALAAFGARVAAQGRNAARGQEQVRQIEATGGTARFEIADAMSFDDWEIASIFVNAAG